MNTLQQPNPNIVKHSFYNTTVTYALLQTMANLMHRFLHTFITILCMYMFRAISCSFSGGRARYCSEHVHVEDRNKCIKKFVH
jgi:hypothetical protein